MSVGFNGLSTVLNHPTRRAHPIDPHSSRYPALAFPPLPPPDSLAPSEAPDPQAYVRAVKPAWFQSRRTLPSHRPAAEQETEQVAPLDTVPEVFFDSEFNLSDPRYFERVFEVSASTPELPAGGDSSATAVAQQGVDSIPALLGEKLSFYSDVVEQHLVLALSERSDAILDAASNLQALTDAGRRCASDTESLQASVRAMDADVAHTGATLPLRQHRRRRLQTLLSTLERIQSVVSQSERAEQLAQQRRWLDALQAAKEVRSALAEPLAIGGSEGKLKLSDIGSLNALFTRLDGSTTKTSDALSGELQAALKEWIVRRTADRLVLEAKDLALPSSLGESETDRWTKLRTHREQSLRSILSLAAEQLAAATAEASPLPGTEPSPVVNAAPVHATDSSSDASPEGGANEEEEHDQVNARADGLMEIVSPLLGALAQANALDSVPRALQQATTDAISDIAQPAWVAAHTPNNVLETMIQLVSPATGQNKVLEDGVAYLRSLNSTEFLNRTHVYLDALLDMLHTADQALHVLQSPNQGYELDQDAMNQVRTHARAVVQSCAARVFAARGLVLGSALPSPSLQDLEDPATVWSDPELVAFLPPFQLGWGFMLKSRLPSGGCTVGGTSDVLRSTLLRLAREFVSATHGRRLSSAAVSVDTERWNAKSVPEPIQGLVETILLGATEDPAQLIISSDSTTSTTTQPASSTSQSDPKTLEIEGHRYYVVGATLQMLPQLGRYCRLVVNLPIICVEVLARLVEFLKQFNSRVCQLVLGAGALRSAGLSNINARHLALAEQSLQAVVSLLPYVREMVRRHLPKRMKLMLTEFDRLRQDYTDHRMEIQSKLVSILQERIAVHSRSLRVLNWDQAAEAESRFRASVKSESPKEEEGQATEQPSDRSNETPQLPPLAGLLRDSTTLSTILSRYLPTGTLESIMRRAGASIDLHLSETVRAIDWDGLENPARSNAGSARPSLNLSRTSKDLTWEARSDVTPRDTMRVDLNRFVSHLQRLNGMAWDPSNLLKLQETVLAARPAPVAAPAPHTPRVSTSANRPSLSMSRDSPAPAPSTDQSAPPSKPSSPVLSRRTDSSAAQREGTAQLGSPVTQIPSAANYAPPQPAPAAPTIKYRPRQRPPRRRSTASPAPSPPPGTMSPASPGSSYPTSYVPRRSTSGPGNAHLRAPSEPVPKSRSPLGSPVPLTPSISPPPPKPQQPSTNGPSGGVPLTRPHPRRAVTVPVSDDEDGPEGPAVHVTAPSSMPDTVPAVHSDDLDDDIPLSERAASLSKATSPVPEHVPQTAASPEEVATTDRPAVAVQEAPQSADQSQPAASIERTPSEPAVSSASELAPDTQAKVDQVKEAVLASTPAPAKTTHTEPVTMPVPPPLDTATASAQTKSTPTDAAFTPTEAAPSTAPPAPTPATPTSPIQQTAPASATPAPERRSKRMSLKERLAEATRKRGAKGRSSISPTRSGTPTTGASVQGVVPPAQTTGASSTPAEVSSSDQPATSGDSARDTSTTNAHEQDGQYGLAPAASTETPQTETPTGTSADPLQSKSEPSEAIKAQHDALSITRTSDSNEPTSTDGPTDGPADGPSDGPTHSPSDGSSAAVESTAPAEPDTAPTAPPAAPAESATLTMTAAPTVTESAAPVEPEGEATTEPVSASFFDPVTEPATSIEPTATTKRDTPSTDADVAASNDLAEPAETGAADAATEHAAPVAPAVDSSTEAFKVTPDEAAAPIESTTEDKSSPAQPVEQPGPTADDFKLAQAPEEAEPTPDATVDLKPAPADPASDAAPASALSDNSQNPPASSTPAEPANEEPASTAPTEADQAAPEPSPCAVPTTDVDAAAHVPEEEAEHEAEPNADSDHDDEEEKRTQALTKEEREREKRRKKKKAQRQRKKK